MNVMIPLVDTLYGPNNASLDAMWKRPKSITLALLNLSVNRSP